MRIKDIPKQDRPRERFLKQGAEVLSDAELFAILLRTGHKGENVIDMSHRLIKEYGLNRLFECSLEELQKIKGIGPSKAMQILTVTELHKRHALSKNPVKKITCAKDVFQLFHERLKDEKQEHFIVLMLNTKNNIIGEKTVFKGTLDSAIVEPREIFREAVRNASSRIILVHNHPSGDPTPSQEDLDITKKLTEAGRLMNITVLDHVIVGEGRWWSNRDSGL